MLFAISRWIKSIIGLRPKRYDGGAGGVDAPPALPQPATEKAKRAMTKLQYISACKKLGLTTVREMADQLGISPAMAQRYAAGKWPPSKTVAKLLRALVALGTTEI